MKQGRLILENGWVVHGESIGAEGRVAGRLVAHTDMTGYQELLADPACRGQICCMTYPLVGNVGVSVGSGEATSIQASGVLFREAQSTYSNYLGEQPLTEWIRTSETVALSGVDTREVMAQLRRNGGMNAVITTYETDTSDEMAAWAREAQPGELPGTAAATPPRILEPCGEHRFDVHVLDLGMPDGFCDALRERGCRTTVWSDRIDLTKILADQPDGIVLSPGPSGSPQSAKHLAEAIKEGAGQVPVLGLGSGFLALAMAFGWEPKPMRHGHHGANHPVREIETGRTYITKQNHWIGLPKDDALPDTGQVVSMRNVNDGSVEGIRFSPVTAGYQFVPDSHAQSFGTGHLWDSFLADMKRST
ncbi:MAG: carbamoyl phosphate synthase small subunit [Clostridiaceae bacterium]|nr:carbamoyl phosphate synthase small subunit [Clostridiaceae bacterium]